MVDHHAGEREAAVRAASSVRRVWLIVPRLARATTSSGSPSSLREIGHREVRGDRHEQAARSLHERKS